MRVPVVVKLVANCYTPFTFTFFLLRYSHHANIIVSAIRTMSVQKCSQSFNKQTNLNTSDIRWPTTVCKTLTAPKWNLTIKKLFQDFPTTLHSLLVISPPAFLWQMPNSPTHPDFHYKWAVFGTLSLTGFQLTQKTQIIRLSWTYSWLTTHTHTPV